MIRMPPTEKRWITCPNCGMKTVLADNAANCSGVYIKCTRGCKRVFELIIRQGEPVIKNNVFTPV